MNAKLESLISAAKDAWRAEQASGKVRINVTLDTSSQARGAEETIAKLNERLAAWAKDRKNVIVVDMAALVAKVQQGEEIRVGANLYEKGKAIELLQPDKLHTTLEGTTAMWAYAVETLAAARKDLDVQGIERDIKAVVTKVDAELGAKVIAKAGKPAEQPAPRKKAG